VPAILEYLPYRKRDGTATVTPSPTPISPYGYAAVRVDIAAPASPTAFCSTSI